jgi:hypothetical protein
VQARPTGDPPGDPDRSAELETRPGWAWLRVMRRYDEYQRALALVESERPGGAEPALVRASAREFRLSR